jgi:hypothetical protein
VIPAWRSSAACAGHPRPELWDAWLDGETLPQSQARHAQAKAVCAGCPVKDACAAHALTASPRVEGIWGGRLFLPAITLNKRAARDREINHGTEGGYKAHRRRGERACNSCDGAMRRVRQDRAAKKRAS